MNLKKLHKGIKQRNATSPIITTGIIIKEKTGIIIILANIVRMCHSYVLYRISGKLIKFI